jgi:hypothetical protein
MTKKTKKINNSDDYEKSSYKHIMEDMEDTKNARLESIPKISKQQFQVIRKYQRRYCTVMIIMINEKSRGKLIEAKLE